MEERHNFLTDHFEVFLIAAYIALMAMVIFFLALTTGFQIGLFIASALILVWMLHQHRSDEPPCGSNIGGEGIARPMPGHEVPKEPRG
jgi:membrane protein implicated in regulation of membrane protease activity